MSPTTSESSPALEPELEATHDTSTSLLLESSPDMEAAGMTRSQAFNLYTSHLLSTWNVRTYEFAAVSIRSSGDLEVRKRRS